MPENEVTNEDEVLETGVEVEVEEEPKESDLKDDIDDSDVEDNDKSFGLDDDGEARKPQKIDEDMVSKDYKDAILVNPKRAEVQKYRSRSEITIGADFTKGEDIERVWNSLEEEDHSEPRKYDMTAADYLETDVIQHNSLGKGYILEILPNKKINVLFENGVKKLVIAR